jgi:DNA-directed RNA polymerase sigma subunit (sigma70/sigma32)
MCKSDKNNFFVTFIFYICIINLSKNTSYMALIYSNSTIQYLKELTAQTKRAKYSSDKHLESSRTRDYRRLINYNTDDFEPVEENREILIKSLLPMVVKIAKGICRKYGARVEYDDCISAGNMGAVIATDIYIKKSKASKQPAKLSTYAHMYITKYVNDHCYCSTTLLSHGPTKWVKAQEQILMSGNSVLTDEGRSVEFFDIANDEALMSINNVDLISFGETPLTKLLFSKLTVFDKEVIFLSFGIGTRDSETKNIREISKILNCHSEKVRMSLESSISLMKNSLSKGQEEQLTDNVNTLHII